MGIALVCVDWTYNCKSVWQLVNTTVSVARIVSDWSQNGAKQPTEKQETAAWWQKAVCFL